MSKNPSSSKFSTIKVTAFFYSPFKTFTSSCLSSNFRRLFVKISKSTKKFLLQFLFIRFDFKFDSRFDSKLLIFWTFNFHNCFDFEFYIHFDTKIPVLWTMNIERRFDYRLGHFSETFI